MFTHPDITENEHAQLILEASRDISQAARLSGNVFYRHLDSDTFNGDGTVFDECEFAGGEFLVEEDFEDVNGDGECSAADDQDIEQVLDSDGAPIPAVLGDSELNAINNIGRASRKAMAARHSSAWNRGCSAAKTTSRSASPTATATTRFDSVLEVASLLENRATTRTGIFAQEFATAVGSEVRSASAYFLDTLKVSEPSPRRSPAVTTIPASSCPIAAVTIRSSMATMTTAASTRPSASRSASPRQ